MKRLSKELVFADLRYLRSKLFVVSFVRCTIVCSDILQEVVYHVFIHLLLFKLNALWPTASLLQEVVPKDSDSKKFRLN